MTVLIWLKYYGREACPKIVMECKGKWLMVAVVFNYGKSRLSQGAPNFRQIQGKIVNGHDALEG